jgi:predicted DNA-binding ribbon-helix-helix protein
MVDEKLLRIFMQDHMAGATAGLELAKRARGANRGTTYADALAQIADEIAEDRKALEELMSDLGFGSDRAKNVGAWAGEKLGRLKLNGRLTGYSPLSRVIELEGLLGGISLKLSLWGILLEVAEQEPRLDSARLRRLITRGEEQRRTVAELRAQAAREAFLRS